MINIIFFFYFQHFSMNQHHLHQICLSFSSSYNLDQIIDRMGTHEKSQNSGEGFPQKKQSFFYSQQSKKQNRDGQELSFQRDLLKEHIEVINKELPAFEIFLDQNKCICKDSISFKMATEQTQIHSKIAGNTKIDAAKQEPLVISSLLKLHNNLPPQLYKFIKKLRKTTPNDVDYALAAITRLIWNKYQHSQGGIHQIYQLLNYSQSILSQLQLETQNTLFAKALPMESREYLTNFLQIYCATVLLVANEYFQNPYCEKPSYSLPESDDEELEALSKCNNKRLHRDSTDALFG